MKKGDLAYNQGFHDAYYGRAMADTSPHYVRGFADGSRARPMLTIIPTRTGAFRTVCTGAQAKRMMEDL